VVQVGERADRCLLGNQAAQAPDDLAGALGLSDDLLHRLNQLRWVGQITMKPAARAVGEVDDRR